MCMTLLFFHFQQYLDAAEQDKERYNREFSDYKQTEAYRLFSERQTSEKQNESTKKERNGTEIPAVEQIVIISFFFTLLIDRELLGEILCTMTLILRYHKFN